MDLLRRVLAQARGEVEGVTPLVEPRYASEPREWIEEIAQEVEASPRTPHAPEPRALARVSERARERSSREVRNATDSLPSDRALASEPRVEEHDLSVPPLPPHEPVARADLEPAIELREARMERSPDLRSPARAAREKAQAPSESPVERVIERIDDSGEAEPRRMERVVVRETTEVPIDGGVAGAAESAVVHEHAAGPTVRAATRPGSPAASISRAAIARAAISREVGSGDREEVVEIHIGRIDARVERPAAPAKPARRGTTLRAYLDKRRARDE